MLKDLRIRAGFLTRDSFANALKTKKYNIDKWETGKAMPRVDMLPKMASVLNVSMGELVTNLNETKLKGD